LWEWIHNYGQGLRVPKGGQLVSNLRLSISPEFPLTPKNTNGSLF
jgi:hypothetical protein